MQSIPFIAWCLDHLNYWVITLLMAIESSFIPFPSEIVVPPAAYQAAHGDKNVFLVVFFATVGALIGASVNYALAYYLGRPIVYKFANSRIGHMCLIDENKVMVAEKYFDDYSGTPCACRTTAYQHSCRSGSYEFRQVPTLYYYWCWSLELYSGCYRVFAGERGTPRTT